MPKGGKVVLIYGESGTYKTSNVGMFAKWIYEKTGKATRLLSGDGGGWAPIQPEIDAGIIVPFSMVGIDNPIDTPKMLCRGYWPEYNKEKQKTELLPPTEETWKEIGGYAFEGITSFATLAMRKLAAKGPRLGQDPSYKYIEGTTTAYGLNQSYYGFVQNHIFDLLILSNNLPVERVLWTAHETEATDDDGSKSTIIGPEVVGAKATPKVPTWVGDCLHYDFYIKEEKKIEGSRIPQKIYGVRAYFVPHPHERTGYVQKAKPRVPPAQLPALMERYPGGYFEPSLTSGLDEYLSLIEELTAKQTCSLASWKEEIDNTLFAKSNLLKRN